MKKYVSKIIMLFIIIFFATTFSACWDYGEMNEFKYVAGMAVDKDKDKNEYILTSEILETSMDGKSIESSIVQSRGKTLHSALRDAIKTVGKKLQVSHAKVFVISKDIAEEGVIQVIDLINRDVELRNDMWILISQMDTASQILSKEKKGNEIVAYDLASTIKNSSKSDKYVAVETFKLINDISNVGVSASAPMVKVIKKEKKLDFEVFGAAIFKGEKMIGKLNEEESLFLQLLKEEKAEFILPIEISEHRNISLEMLNIKRDSKVNVREDKVCIDMYINMDVALSELAETGVDYVSKKERQKFKKYAEKHIENHCYQLIEKLQKEYKSDVVGFGNILKIKKPNQWEKFSSKWNEVFENACINVFVNLDIQYSGLTNKNIRVGD